jgi:hypothetical protein
MTELWPIFFKFCRYPIEDDVQYFQSYIYTSPDSDVDGMATEIYFQIYQWSRRLMAELQPIFSMLYTPFDSDVDGMATGIYFQIYQWSHTG